MGGGPRPPPVLSTAVPPLFHGTQFQTLQGAGAGALRLATAL